ncbi:MAG: TolC family protein [Muribaculaceae bacterium]|nr:TolC family protein [Muribaculaceae bacterium]
MKNIIIAIACAASALPLAASGPVPDSLLTPSSMATSIVTGAPLSDAMLIGAEAAGYALMPEANLPDPRMEGEVLGGPAGVKPRWNAGISWELDWPGVYSARRRLAADEARALQYDAYADILSRSADVRALIIGAIHDMAAIRTLREIEADNDSMMLHLRKGVEHGQMTRLDISKLSIEQARVRSRISDLHMKLDETIATLNGEYDARLDSVTLVAMHYDSPEIAPLEIYMENLRASMSFVALRAGTQAARSAMTVARRENLPGIGVGYVHAFEDGTHFNGGSLSVSIPIFSSKGKTKAAEAALFAAEADEDVRTQAALRTLDERYSLAAELKKRAEALAPALLDVSQYELLHKAWLGGEWSLLRYLQERAYFLEARLDYLAIERDLQLAISELTRGMR